VIGTDCWLVEIVLQHLGKGSWKLRLACLLVGILLLGQVHLCSTTYVTSAGKACVACDQIRVTDDCAKSIAQSHGDCHDCCTIQSCEDGNQLVAKVVLASSFQIVAILPPSVEVISYRILSSQVISVPYDPGVPTTGPPLNKSSRAPPAI
jgi:hypothetical protein